ncbi:MAG: PP2C family serine/threonine-protein phosphatase [Granulosicoccus sp.]
MNTIWTGHGYTDTGSVRTLNEDCVLTRCEHSLWAVADGMGGHNNGDYASQHVIGGLADYHFSPLRGISVSRIRSLLFNSNIHLINKARKEQADVIGCTVAALSIHGNVALCSWSGDSRIYRVRRGRLNQLTRDHSQQSLAEDSNPIDSADISVPNGQMLTCAIGGERDIRVEHCLYELLRLDRFLICTDGLYKEICAEEILDIALGNISPESFIDSIATLYTDRGARDNIGMVYIKSAEV